MEEDLLASFDALLRDKRPTIKKFANGSKGRVPGLDREEVEVEMELALYKAWRTYDVTAGTKFDTWWFQVWTTWKANLIEAYFRKKRQMIVLHDFAVEDGDILSATIAEVDEAFDGLLVARCPINDQLHTQVWNLLSQGYRFNEVQTQLGISRKVFDRVMTTFRTDPRIAASLGVA